MRVTDVLQVLTSWFDHLLGSPEVDLGVDLIIYLRTSPQVQPPHLLHLHLPRWPWTG